MFDRFPVSEVRNDIKYYFADGKAPPNVFINDGSTIPTMQFTTASQMRVSFMYEGAGNRNQLGYFTYSLTNGVPRLLTETILFPDILDSNCLSAGHTVTTPLIPAGTYFGFFLIADGRCNPSTTQKYYTISSFNTPGDVGTRHVGMYVDGFRELLIIGFEDLLMASSDRDYEDTMFIFDSSGLEIQFDGVPFACTNSPCKNGGVCNYSTGTCNCTLTKYTGRSCETCSCADTNPCTVDTCTGPSCNATFWSDSISSCLNTQGCNHAAPVCPSSAVTTGVMTTGVATTRAPTTGIPTTGIPTTGVPTTGRVNPTTGVVRATTGVPTTGVPTTAVATTALPTTGEIQIINTHERPSQQESLTDDGFNTVTLVPESAASLTTISFFVCVLFSLLY